MQLSDDYLTRTECEAMRKYASSFMLLALFQTASEGFRGFYNIFMQSEFSLLSFSPGEHLLTTAGPARTEEKRFTTRCRSERTNVLPLLLVGVGSEWLGWQGTERVKQHRLPQTQSPLPPELLFIVRCLSGCAKSGLSVAICCGDDSENSYHYSYW